MKTLYLEQPKGQQTLHIILMAIFLAQGVLNLRKPDDTFMLILAILQISLAGFYGFYYFSVLKPKRPKYAPQINLNENEISFFKGLFYKPKTIQHKEIKVVQLKPERVSVMTKEFDFTYHFDYDSSNKAQIQHELEAYCELNNLPVEKVSYR
ncbi:hypothetical protein [Ekhidna sp.]|uniref:hypothetical protein n=1 Tax=Ekhidna sp. TaxID=2608089 RepID=UPI003CCC02B3